jgi:hypothetical protein
MVYESTRMWTLSEMIIDMGKPKYSKTKLAQCHLFHHIYPRDKGSNPYFRGDTPEMRHDLDGINTLQFDSLHAVENVS